VPGPVRGRIPRAEANGRETIPAARVPALKSPAARQARITRRDFTT